MPQFEIGIVHFLRTFRYVNSILKCSNTSIRFINTSLDDVLKVLSEIYGVSIVVKSLPGKGYFTGNLSTTGLGESLDVISAHVQNSVWAFNIKKILKTRDGPWRLSEKWARSWKNYLESPTPVMYINTTGPWESFWKHSLCSHDWMQELLFPSLSWLKSGQTFPLLPLKFW